MTRYLVRKCPLCGNVVKIIKEGNKIVDVSGGRQDIIARKLNAYSYGEGQPSEKMVYCTALTREHMDGRSACFKRMRISKFEEMKI